MNTRKQSRSQPIGSLCVSFLSQWTNRTRPAACDVDADVDGWDEDDEVFYEEDT